MSVKTRNKVVGFVKSDKYNPAPLPVLQTVPRLASLAQREDFKSIGYGIVNGCVFISTVGSISGKPLGYSKFIRGIARHREVLHAVIEKVDHQLVVDVANVGEALAEFVGAQWLESGANLDEPEKSDLSRSFQWLRPVLEPVLRVAAEDFIKMHRLNEQDTAAWLIKRDARLPPGLQFFENVYQIQNRPPPQEPASTEFSFADSDGETDLFGVENLDKTELQHEADGDADKSASSGSDDDADDDEDDDVEADQDAEDDADDVEGDGTDGNLDADNQSEIAVDANSSSFDFSSSDISMRTADASTGSAPDALAADGTKIQTHHLVALAENIAAMAAAVPRSPVLRDSPGTGLNGIAPSDLHALFVSPPGISANMANWRLPSLSPNPSADRALREFTNDVGTLKTPSPLWSEVRREVRVTDGVDGYLSCLDGSRAGDEVICSPRARTTLFSGPSLLGPAFQLAPPQPSTAPVMAQTGEPTPLSFYLVQPVAPLDAVFEPEPPTAAAKVQATPERKGDGRIPLSPFNFQHKDPKGKGRAH